MPEYFSFETVSVAPGRKTVWFEFDWQNIPGVGPNHGPIVVTASPKSHGDAETRLVVEDFAKCRNAPPKTEIFYFGNISNLGAQATFAKLEGVWFPELQGDFKP